MSKRIYKTFSDKKKKLVTFVTGGDPSQNISEKILKSIIKSGADLIEIGMPFSDPMADGPTIQLSSKRAINEGINLENIFNICINIRKINNEIPIILMGYYNVIHSYGIKNFTNKCVSSGIDGLIIVDLQPEEDSELYESVKLHDIDLIRLITPTTTKERLKIISETASGFLYYVTITGITGQKSADIKELKKSIRIIRNYSSLPIVAGFGINSKEQVLEICKTADGVVVGSSIVKIIQDKLEDEKDMLDSISKFVKKIKSGTIL
tara:strand:+ start:1256 stop:2050 length:795 start_codon:yes stop_codon:yes gene_type:complete